MQMLDLGSHTSLFNLPLFLIPHEPVNTLWAFFLVKKVLDSSKRYLVTYPKSYHRIMMLKRSREGALGKVRDKLDPCLSEAGRKLDFCEDRISLQQSKYNYTQKTSLKNRFLKHSLVFSPSVYLYTFCISPIYTLQ